MKKLAAILFGTAVVTAGAIGTFLFVKHKRKPKVQDPWETGLYTVNMFKKITRDMNRTIAETEKRLADHDKLQKMYEEMEWKTCNN